MKKSSRLGLLLCLAVTGILPAAGQTQIRDDSFSFAPSSAILNPGSDEAIIVVDSGSVAFVFDKESPMGIIIVDTGRRAPLSIKIIRGDNLVSENEISIRVIPPDDDRRDADLKPQPGTFKIGLKAAKGAEASADYQLRFDIGREKILIPGRAFELQIGKGF